MAERGVLNGLRVVTRRDFWTFKVIHAVLGAALTLAGACGAIFIGDALKGKIGAQDSLIARANDRIATIDRVLLQFRLVQSNSILLGALSTGGGVRPEFREELTKLMFTLRHGPALTLVAELYQHDPAEMKKQQAELDRLTAAAIAPDRTQQSWADMLAFETTREGELIRLQDQFRVVLFAAQTERRRLERYLDTATIGGFMMQQLGFVIVLLAGLIHQYGERVRPATVPNVRAETHAAE